MAKNNTHFPVASAGLLKPRATVPASATVDTVRAQAKMMRKARSVRLTAALPRV
jgi:hypothetical protein